MIISNSVARLVLKAISAFSWSGGRHDSPTICDNRGLHGNSPFVLVACDADGRWGVYQQDFDKPAASFDGLQEACDYANELARTRVDSMVLIGKRPASAGRQSSSMPTATT